MYMLLVTAQTVGCLLMLRAIALAPRAAGSPAGGTEGLPLNPQFPDTSLARFGCCVQAVLSP